MPNTLTRRTLLKQTAAAAIAPMILPSGVLAANGKPGANDRLVVGHIGIGGMGSGHLKFIQGHDSFTSGALCDVDQEHLARAKDIVGRDVPTYNDYRKVLEQKDLDAVIIAAPDHWHGVMAVQACEAGKHVYVEKPSSVTVEEGRAMVKAARKHNRVMQVGSQGRSQEGAWKAWNYIRNGQIGDVTRVDCWHYENPEGGDWNKNGPAPSTLDWDLWLGPAQWVPYNPDRVHFNFRWFLDFGGGQIRDRGAHVLSVISWILDLDTRHPARITATGTPPATGMYNCPPKMEVIYEYEDPKLTITWNQPGVRAVDYDFGAVYQGTSDKLVVRGGDGGTFTEDKAMKYEPGAGGKHAFVSPGQHVNWLDCIKSGDKPIMDIEPAHAVAKMCILANISYRIQRPIRWDGEHERIIDDPAAEHMLGTAGRGEFHL